MELVDAGGDREDPLASPGGVGREPYDDLIGRPAIDVPAIEDTMIT